MSLNLFIDKKFAARPFDRYDEESIELVALKSKLEKYFPVIDLNTRKPLNERQIEVLFIKRMSKLTKDDWLKLILCIHKMEIGSHFASHTVYLLYRLYLEHNKFSFSPYVDTEDHEVTSALNSWYGEYYDVKLAINGVYTVTPPERQKTPKEVAHIMTKKVYTGNTVVKNEQYIGVNPNEKRNTLYYLIMWANSYNFLEKDLHPTYMLQYWMKQQRYLYASKLEYRIRRVKYDPRKESFRMEKGLEEKIVKRRGREVKTIVPVVKKIKIPVGFDMFQEQGKKLFKLMCDKDGKLKGIKDNDGNLKALKSKQELEHLEPYLSVAQRSRSKTIALKRIKH